MSDDKNKVEIFNRLRKRLFGIAYRMLGTPVDAEDIVQEAYLRWHKARIEEIDSHEAWLVTITTRLSIDRLRQTLAERKKYIGPWLPEPLFAGSGFSAVEQIELASNLKLAFLVLLERLTPLERAAFLLRDVFDCSYSEIAKIIGKSEISCRQVIHRARTRVQTDQPRFEASEDDRKRLIQKFTAAVAASDEQALLSLFAEDATLTPDSGGKVTAAREVIFGNTHIARLFSRLERKSGGQINFQTTLINGETGIVTLLRGNPFGAMTFNTDGERIFAVYQIMNPDKLKSLINENKNI